MIDPQTSFNFAVAKVLAILLVVTGHFFKGSLLWVPVTAGLFVFAYSSAYFTARKYGARISAGAFWLNKVKRLAVPFLLTQGFLLGLFLVAGREGIGTWQTVVHWLGQSGWLNWLGLPNPSPFGSGLWFFTLLLIFYLAYPYVAYVNRPGPKAHISLVLVLVLALALNQAVDVGYALWPMVAANVAGVKALNVYLLVAASVAVVLWLERGRLPRAQLSWLLWLSSCALEIYLIHTYLFVDWGMPLAVRFAVSMAVIVGCAKLIAHLAERLERKLFHARPAHS